MDGLLLLADLLFLVIRFVRDIHLDTQLISQFIDTSTLSTDDTTDIFPFNLELGRLDGSR